MPKNGQQLEEQGTMERFDSFKLKGNEERNARLAKVIEQINQKWFRTFWHVSESSEYFCCSTPFGVV